MELQDEFMQPQTTSQILRGQFGTAESVLPQQLQQEIQKLIDHRNDKTYAIFVEDGPLKYFQLIWNKQVESQPDLQEVILPKMGERYRKVYKDLINQNLQIQLKSTIAPYDFNAELKNQKILFLKEQTDHIRRKLEQINENLANSADIKNETDPTGSRSRMYDSEQKHKEWEQTRKKYKQEKQQRHKKLEESKKKQQEDLIKKQAEIKQHEQQLIKERRDEVAKKLKQLHETRQKDKEMRQKRNTEYIRIKRQTHNKPPLFQRIENDYNKRYAQVEVEQRKRLLSERKSVFQHIEQMKLSQHEKFYEKIKEQRQEKRKQRQEDMLQMQKSRAKYHSSFQLTKKPDPKQEQKQLAREKWEKVRQYKDIVKLKYKPTVDQAKRQELMSLIEDIQQGRKKLKKIKQQDGSFTYEEIRPSDPNVVGKKYLGEVKQMAARYKLSGKRKASADLAEKVPEKKVFNYLEQMKANRPQQTKKSSFIDRKSMSYDQKVKKIELEAAKLHQITKQKQEKLKHGKFKSSEQILAYKDEIDNNYMEIVRMKLQLVSQKQRQDSSYFQ